MIKFYCERCGKYQEVIYDHRCQTSKLPYHDILCKKCKLYLTGFTTDEPREYEIRRKE